MMPKFRVWMKSLKWMCDVTNISFDSKFVDICQQGDTERYTEMSVEFDEITLMQSTGLFDKNGKEIFEGDVISTYIDNLVIQRDNLLGFYVELDEKRNHFAETVDIEYLDLFAKDFGVAVEIIGNIYENPELLEDKV